MSDVEDDVDIITCPLSTSRSKTIEGPDMLEKHHTTCKDGISENTQLKQTCHMMANMIDTFMDPTVLMVGTVTSSGEVLARS